MNDPLPGQLTVGRLKRLLKGVPDSAVVALLLDNSIEVELPCIRNLRVAKKSALFLTLELYDDLDVESLDPSDSL